MTNQPLNFRINAYNGNGLSVEIFLSNDAAWAILRRLQGEPAAGYHEAEFLDKAITELEAELMAPASLAVLRLRERGKTYYFILHTSVGNVEFYIGKGQQWKMRADENYILAKMEEAGEKLEPIVLTELPAPVRSILSDLTV